MREAIKWIGIVVKGLGWITAAAGVSGSLPEKYAWVGLAVFGGASILKDTLINIADLLDDGQKNNSFKA